MRIIMGINKQDTRRKTGKQPQHTAILVIEAIQIEAKMQILIHRQTRYTKRAYAVQTMTFLQCNAFGEII